MDKTATEVVLQLVASGMEKEAGILTSPIRKFLRSRSDAGRLLNEALALRANRPELNKQIVTALRSNGDDRYGKDLARAFNSAKPRNKATVLEDAAKRRGQEIINNGWDITNNYTYRQLWDLHGRYMDHAREINNRIRRANDRVSRDLK